MPVPHGDQTLLRLHVRGRVQGVGFRYFTLRAARERGLLGWVRNEPDGSVLCEVHGAADVVERFVDIVQRGPSFAQVEDVAIERLEFSDFESTEFEIR